MVGKPSHNPHRPGTAGRLDLLLLRPHPTTHPHIVGCLRRHVTRIRPHFRRPPNPGHMDIANPQVLLLPRIPSHYPPTAAVWAQAARRYHPMPYRQRRQCSSPQPRFNFSPILSAGFQTADSTSEDTQHHNARRLVPQRIPRLARRHLEKEYKRVITVFHPFVSTSLRPTKQSDERTDAPTPPPHIHGARPAQSPPAGHPPHL